MPTLHPPVDESDNRIPTQLVQVDELDLRAAEAKIADCIARRDVTNLRVLGFGEISVALGWPTTAPEMVLKRMAVYRDRADAGRDLQLIRDYINALERAGVHVLPTSCHLVPRQDGRWVNYAVQPLVPKHLLAESTIATDQPRPDHPLLVAIRDLTMAIATPRLAADMQVTNFAWDGERLVLIDITTPLMFDENGDFPHEIADEVLIAVPAFSRQMVLRESFKIMKRYQDGPQTLSFVLLLLHRIGEQRWVPAAAECFNQVLDTPIDLAAVEAEYRRYNKAIPIMNRTAMVQRWWLEKVRRRSYDFFITDSFTGAVL